MNFFDKIIQFLKSLEESIQKEKDSSKLKILELRFSQIESKKYFTFLDLYSPMDFPLEVTSEDVARYIESLKTNGDIYFEFYIKCPNCDFNEDLLKETETIQKCIRCNHETEKNKENIYIRFKKK